MCAGLISRWRIPETYSDELGSTLSTLIKRAFISLAAEWPRATASTNTISPIHSTFARFVRHRRFSVALGLEVCQIITRTPLSCWSPSRSQQCSCAKAFITFKPSPVLSCLACSQASTLINQLYCQCLSLDFFLYLWGPGFSTRLFPEYDRLPLC